LMSILSQNSLVAIMAILDDCLFFAQNANPATQIDNQYLNCDW